MSIRDLPDPAATGQSGIGRLLAELQAAEAAADAQRLVVSACRDSYKAAELALRRASYCLPHVRPTTEELDAMHAQVLALQAQRDIEGQKPLPLLARVRELQAQWDHDYAEFVRLQHVVADLHRLGG